VLAGKDAGVPPREDKTMNDRDEKFAFVDYMQAEHRRLEQLLRRTLAALPSWEEADTDGWLPRMTAGLTAIRAELAHHFRTEEQGGCLEEAVARCPQLSPDVEKIEREHDELLEHLDELIARCQTTAAPTAAQARALEQEFRQIVHELKLHEVEENRIMQRGFSVCLEGEELDAGVLDQRVLDRSQGARSLPR
jgi:iron-sulfur cluster repair protein YtfE (RIC family)